MGSVWCCPSRPWCSRARASPSALLYLVVIHRVTLFKESASPYEASRLFHFLAASAWTSRPCAALAGSRPPPVAVVCRDGKAGILLKQKQEQRQHSFAASTSTASPPRTQADGSGRRLAYIDGLRGLAVAGVVLFHARTWSGADWSGLYLLGLGRAGVDLFLVLTGFCLFLPLVQQGNGQVAPLNLREYARRRARRILPPYYAALLLAIGACAVVYGFAGPSWLGEPFQKLFPLNVKGATDIVLHIALAHGLNGHTGHGIEGAFWTLSLEAQFYTLFPLLVWVARREYISLAVLITLFTSLAFRYYMNENHPVVLLRPFGDELCVSRWAEFGLGMLAAAWAVGAWGGRRADALKRHPALFIVTGLILLMTCGLELYDSHLYLLPLVWGLACCLLLVCASQPGRLRRFLEWPPLVRLGTLSYTLYLLHDTVFRLMAVALSRYSVPPEVRAYLIFFVGIPLTLAVGIPFFRCFERPFMSRRPPDVAGGPQLSAFAAPDTTKPQASPTQI